MLGWKKIVARVGVFTDEVLRDIELEENEVRLDFTPLEGSKARLRQFDKEAAAIIAYANVSDKKLHASFGQATILSGGNKKERNRLGVQIHRDRKHVSSAVKFPVLAGK